MEKATIFAVWAANLIALLALFRPELQKFLHFLFIRPKLEVHIFEAAEISFSSISSSIAISCTLRAKNDDLFISKLRADLVRISDSSKRNYQWVALRPTNFTPPYLQLHNLEQPLGFLLAQSNPRTTNLLFSDMQLLEDLTAILKPYKEQWNALCLSEESKVPKNNLAAQSEGLMKLRYNSRYETFFGSDAATECYRKLQKKFYWEAGEYILTLYINTSSPDKENKYSWNFKLNEEQVNMINLNIVSIMRQRCGLPDFIFNSVDVELNPVSDSSKL